MPNYTHLEYFLLCLSGLSGSGKTTIVDALESKGVCRRVRTTTTRPRREGEPEDAYHFVSPMEFETLIQTNALLEWQQYGQEFYGLTQKAILKAVKPHPHKAIAILGLPGVRAVKQRHPRVEAVWLNPDRDHGLDAISARMEERGDPADKIASRLAQATDEFWEAQMSGLYDHTVLNLEGKQDQAIQSLEKILSNIGLESTSGGTVKRRPLYDALTGERIPWSRVEASGYAHAESPYPPPRNVRFTSHPGIRWHNNDTLYVRVDGEWRRILLTRQKKTGPPSP